MFLASLALLHEIKQSFEGVGVVDELCDPKLFLPCVLWFESIAYRIFCQSKGSLDCLMLKFDLEGFLNVVVDSLHENSLIQLFEGLDRNVFQHSSCHVCFADLLLDSCKHLLDWIVCRSVLRERESHELTVSEELPDRFLQVKLGVVEDEDKFSSDSGPFVPMVFL